MIENLDIWVGGQGFRRVAGTSLFNVNPANGHNKKVFHVGTDLPRRGPTSKNAVFVVLA